MIITIIIIIIIIQKTKPNLLRNKENLPSNGFCYSSGPLSENKRKQKDGQILAPCQRPKKTVGNEDDSDTNCSWGTWNSPKRLVKETGETGNQVEESKPSRLQHC